MEGAHDLGGWSGFGPVVTAGDAPEEPFDPDFRAQVICLLAAFPIGANLRRYIEELDPLTYLRSSYSDRWVRATEAAVVANGVWRRRTSTVAVGDRRGEPVPTASNPDSPSWWSTTSRPGTRR